MKRYIKSSKGFINTNGERYDVDRETKILTYVDTRDGDYFSGSYHVRVIFKDDAGTKYEYQKILTYDMNEYNPYNLEEGQKVSVSGYFVPNPSGLRGDDSIWYSIVNPRVKTL